MNAVYKRELKAQMTSMYGLLFAAILLCVVAVVMYRINLQVGLADTSYNLMGFCEYALALTIPVLCMRSVTYDRKHGTDRLYFSLPLRTSTVVLGKYFALLTVFAIPMAVICLYPLFLNGFGNVNFSSAYTSILTFFLLGAALIALCMFIASLTRYMVVSAVTGVLSCALLYLMPHLAELIPYTSLASFVGFGILAILAIVIAWFSTKSPMVTAITAAVTVLPLTVLYVLDAFVFSWGIFEDPFYLLVKKFSPFGHFYSAVTEMYLDLFSVATMLAFTAFFLLLTVQSMDRRRRV